MNISRTSISQIKKLYKKISDNKLDPKRNQLVKQAKAEIKFNFKLYGIESEEDFAKDNSFCVDCACGLNADNDCPGCGRQYGW